MPECAKVDLRQSKISNFSGGGPLVLTIQERDKRRYDWGREKVKREL